MDCRVKPGNDTGKGRKGLAPPPPVILVLDTRIHGPARTRRSGIEMECRVEPGNDTKGKPPGRYT